MSESTTITLDHQKLVLTGLIHNSYVISLVQSEMNESYFSDSACRIIYKSLMSYYEKYQKSPSESEIRVLIEQNFIKLGSTTLEEVKNTCSEFYASDEVDEEYLTNKVADLIKRVRISRTLGKTLESIKNNVPLDEGIFLTDLIDSVNVTLEKSSVFTLSDLAKLPEVRRKAIGDGTRSRVIKSILPELNSVLQYKGFQIGTLNLIVSPPSVGKTSYLVNEGAYAALQGYTVLHMFLGDMFDYDGFIRYSACISGELQNDIANMSEADQVKLISDINAKFPGVLDRVDVVSYASGEKTVNEALEEIKKAQEKNEKHYDMIIIDYADNFLKDGVNMYQEGGYIYDKLSLFARINSSVMYVASQPKIGYWDQEIIPMEGAAESSKKQHIVDLMVTFNKRAKSLNFGSMLVAKMRRGISGSIIRVQTEWERCRISQITEDEYKRLVVDAGLDL